MKYLPLLYNSLVRRPWRTLLSILSIAVAFLLFGYLGAIQTGFGRGVELMATERLIVTNKVSLMQPLPQTHQRGISEISGAAKVTFATWLGGMYQGPRGFFAQLAVDPDSWLAVYPEYLLEPSQRGAWAAKRNGAVAGRRLAERMHWTIGSHIPITGTVWRAESDNIWDFELVGIYDGAEPQTDTGQLFFRHDYFDARRNWGRGQVGWYVVSVADAAQAPAIARGIDAAFANSPAETRASSERAFVQELASQVGNVGLVVMVILGAAFFTVLLVVAAAHGQSVSERKAELAVLKSIGFTNEAVLALVLAEALTVASIGAALGMGLASRLIARGDPTGGSLPAFHLPVQYLLYAAIAASAVGLLSGAAPAMFANRLRIADTLRRS